MSKIWTIARHEYLTHLRRPGFLISTFGMPLMLVGLFVVVVIVLLISSQVKAIGYVDQSGLTSGLQSEVAWESSLGTVQIRQYASLDAAKAALQAETIDAVFVVPADFLSSATIEGYALEALPQLAESQFSGFYGQFWLRSCSMSQMWYFSRFASLIALCLMRRPKRLAVRVYRLLCQFSLAFCCLVRPSAVAHT